MRAKVLDEMKRVFNPEFLNRIDDIVVFHGLGKGEMVQIVQILLAEVKMRLKDHEIDLQMTPEATELLIDKGFDPAFGARPLRRAIQRFIEDPLAEHVLRGKFARGSVCQVKRVDDELVFSEADTASEEPQPEPEAAGS